MVVYKVRENLQSFVKFFFYLRDTFVYRMLNHALRTSEAEVLIRMAFFIKDLHRQIEQLHSTLSNVPTIVYRGQKYLFASRVFSQNFILFLA